MVVFFYLIFFSISRCIVFIDAEDILRVNRDLRLGFSVNDGNINHTNDASIVYSGELPLHFKFYMKLDYCTDWVLIYDRTVSSECSNFFIPISAYKSECKSGYIVYFRNLMPFDFNISIIDRKNDTIFLVNNDFCSYKWYQPFSFDIYIESNEYFNEPIFIGILNITNNTETYKNFTFEDIPYQYRPYSINIAINTRYFFKFGYKDLELNDDTIYKIDSNSETMLHHSKPFNVTIYLLSSLTCNNSIPIKLFDIIADKNMKQKIITEEDVPSECKIDIYPDDSPRFQPEESSDSDIPYSVVFDGECKKFKDVYQGCRNKSLKYPLCPFLSNAVEAYCGYDGLYDISPNSSKLFLIAKDQKLYILDYLKHQMIVHVIGNNHINDPDVFFSRSDSFNITERVHITLAHNNGDIASYLIVENVEFHILEKINFTTLHAISSKIWGSLNDVFVKNLILDDCDIDNNYEFDQLTFVLKNETDRPQYQIEYTNENLVLRYKNWNNEFYNDVIVECPLSRAKSFGVITNSHYFDIKVYDESITSIKPLNITLMRFSNLITSYRNRTLLSDNSKYLVELTTSGNWTNINDNPSVTFTANYDYVDFHANVNEKLTVNKSQVYKYPNVGWELQFYQPPNYKDNSLVTYILIHDPSEKYYCDSRLGRLLKIDNVIDGKCVTKESLNEALESINEMTDKIIIGVVDDDVKIDLTNLPRQYVVNILGLESLYDKILPEKKLLSDDKSKYIYRSIEIYGGIKEKVSYLTISNTLFKFYGASLNVHTLRLNYSKPGTNTEIIETNDLIVDLQSHINLFDSYLFKVKQYGIIIPHEFIDGQEETIYRIEFNSGWHLYSKRNTIRDFLPIDETYGYIPYSYAETVCIIAVSHNFEFYIPNEENPESHKVNITIFSEKGVFNDTARWVPKNDNKYDVDLTILGEWKPEYNLNVTFVSFQDYVKVTSNPQIRIEKEEFFILSSHELLKPSQSPAPNPTNIPTMTPIPEIIEKLFDDKINEIIDSKVINDALDKKFDDLKNYEGCKVILVNADSFPFDKQLNDDQYIKPISHSNINYVNGNLNLVLPDNGRVTVNLQEKSNVNIKLRGEGNIEFEGAFSENKININNNAEINGTLKINVPENVETVSIDSINLRKNSVIECKSKNDNDVTLNVKNIQADAYVNAKLNSIKISNSLTIPQSAKIELNNVDVKNSSIYYNIMNFDNLDSILVGEFKDPPKSIKINTLESTNVFESISFNFMEGTFDDGICKQWANLIDFPIENKYKYINCYDSNDGLILAKEQKILIELSNNEKPNTNGNDKNNGLPPGAIAGIVIGVIVVVAIVVVVVIIIRKKKKDYISSNGEDEQKQDEV